MAIKAYSLPNVVQLHRRPEPSALGVLTLEFEGPRLVELGGAAPQLEAASAAVCGSETDGLIVFSNETNYSFSGELEVRLATVKDATDILIDWSGLTADYWGRPVDRREDIDRVVVFLMNQTPEEIVQALNADALFVGSGIVDAILEAALEAGDEALNLSGFSSSSFPLNPEESDRLLVSLICSDILQNYPPCAIPRRDGQRRDLGPSSPELQTRGAQTPRTHQYQQGTSLVARAACADDFTGWSRDRGGLRLRSQLHRGMRNPSGVGRGWGLQGR